MTIVDQVINLKRDQLNTRKSPCELTLSHSAAFQLVSELVEMVVFERDVAMRKVLETGRIKDLEKALKGAYLYGLKINLRPDVEVR